MKCKQFLTLVFIFFIFSSFAQQRKLDSLFLEFEKHPTKDLKQLQLLNGLSVAYSNIQYDSGFAFVERAIVLSEKLNNSAEHAEALKNKGCLLLRKSQFKQSKEYFYKALSINSTLQNKNGMADCYARLAELNNWEGENPDEMDSLIHKALSLYEQTNNTNGVAQCSYLFARWNEFGDLDSTIVFKHTRKALLLFDQTGSKEGKASTFNFMGVTSEILSDYTNAFQYYQQAIDLNSSTGNLFGLCNDYINISGCYFSTDNFTKAIECAVKGLKLGEQLGDVDAQILMLGILGDTYRETKQNEKALHFLEQGYEMAEKIGSKKRIANILTNIHHIYMDQNNFPKAFDCLYRVLAIDIEMNSRSDMADDYTKLAKAYMKVSKYDSALVNYQLSFELLKEIGENTMYADNLLWYGKTINKSPASDLKKAGINPGLRNSIYKESIIRALEVSRKIGVLSTQRDALLELSSIYEHENDLKNSLDCYQKYVSLKDTLMNTENLKSISNLQIQYETEKKEQQIVLLNKDNKLNVSELKRQKLLMNSTIGGVGIIGIFSFLLVRTSNRKKKTIFEKQVSEVEMKALRSQMNPHFIFNALQSVNDFILKKDTMNASNFLIKFSKLMRSVLENSVHKEVTIEKDLASLELYMQLESSRLDIPFDYEIIIDPKIDPETTFIPPLILQPFVENSIWHGLKHKKEKGKIKIEIKEETNSIICSIEDNGVGREKANELKQPTPGKKESLGMKLTKERLKILEQIKNFRSRIDVIDLKDGLNNPLGLRVELSLSLATLN